MNFYSEVKIVPGYETTFKKITSPSHCMFVYRFSNITENTKWSLKYICAKFIYISRNISAHGSDNKMHWK